jgi:hypothetical protein
MSALRRTDFNVRNSQGFPRQVKKIDFWIVVQLQVDSAIR